MSSVPPAPVTGSPGPPAADADPGPVRPATTDGSATEAYWTVAAVARQLGVAPATLRTWDRRYGLGPTNHQPGRRRRYSRTDVERLRLMRKLTIDGVGPAAAAQLAVHTIDAGRCAPEAANPAGTGVSADGAPEAWTPAGRRTAPGGGGRVLALPSASAAARGLARAAMALDAGAIKVTLRESLANHGVVATWEQMLRPVLESTGRRWESRGDGIEVEHLLTEVAVGVLRQCAETTRPARNLRPVLLACCPDEQHSLPLYALAAALAERDVSSRLFGPCLPREALVAAVRRSGPSAVFLWAHQPGTADVEALNALPVLRPAARVIVGGAGWVAPLPPGTLLASSLADAVRLLRTAVAA